jgi:hypothetical protein
VVVLMLFNLVATLTTTTLSFIASFCRMGLVDCSEYLFFVFFNSRLQLVLITLAHFQIWFHSSHVCGNYSWEEGERKGLAQGQRRRREGRKREGRKREGRKGQGTQGEETPQYV